jgi:hypothetical protein
MGSSLDLSDDGRMPGNFRSSWSKDHISYICDGCRWSSLCTFYEVNPY